VLVVAVALGAYFVDLGKGRPAPAAATTQSTSANTGTQTPPTSTTNSTTNSTTTTTTAPVGGVQPNRTVKILVANASQTNGIAAYYSGKLSAAGWGTLTPVTATTSETTSTIYYANGRQQDALAVASALGIASGSVQPLGGSVPVLGATQADIVVVAGDDLAAKVPAATANSG
jgi:hypothetical protein